MQSTSRRTFLVGTTLVFTTSPQTVLMANPSQVASRCRIGLLTDLHHADKPSAGSRHYRETMGKLEEAADKLRAASPTFLVELGDLIDAADSVETEMHYLRTINKTYANICDRQYYVLGNHCVDTLKKEEFLGEVGQNDSYFSFDDSGYHFIVLDACFRSDGTPYQRKNFKWTDANISAEELRWLRQDLAETRKPTIVFAHQRLDVDTAHGVRNNAEVRKILSDAKNVRLVLQGHSHQNDLREIDGIPYCTLVAMVEGSGAENNAYTLLEIWDEETITLKGFRKQNSYDWQ